MRILHVYKDYSPVLGGIENHVKALAEGQAARGHAVTVLVTSRDRHTHVETINRVRVIYAARLTTISSAPVSLVLPRLLAQERPDIVHLQFPYPFGEASNYFFGHGRKTILTYQSDIVRQKFLRVVYGPLMERVLGRVDRILVTSPNYIATSPVLSRWHAKCVVVPLGIDPSPYLIPPPTPNHSREKGGSDGGSGIQESSFSGLDKEASPTPTGKLLFVGRLRYYKGLNYLLEAMRELPDAKLQIVGTGPKQAEWNKLSVDLALGGRVEFIGDVPDAELPAYYAWCDVFVLPASERSEAFGLVQLEAMASGKPVVSCDVGTGVAWVNQDGVTGLVVPPQDPTALAGAIKRLLADRELAATMGAAGRARVLSEFTRDKMLERVIAVYEKEFDL